jgi:rubrerythrin
MGTRSTIALEYADGTVDQIYCHWDGYLSGNGKMLAEHYTDPFKVRQLMDLGDMSTLQPSIGTQHAFEKAPEGECTFYKRDRNESGTDAKRFKDLKDYVENHQYEEFEYILREVNGKATWFVDCGACGYVTLETAFLNAKETA